MIKNMKVSAFEPKWLLTLAFFLSGIFLGGLAIYIWVGAGAQSVVRLHPPSRYKYINPLLAVETQRQEKFSQNKLLLLELQGLIDNFSKNNSVKDVAVYFRDIEASTWAGINEDNKFSPGKLLKIPIMIAYFKIAETNPEILNEKIEYSGEAVKYEGVFGHPEQLASGKYTVGKLIERMIVQYDDTAANLLYDYIDKESLNEVFSDLGIPFKEDKYTQDFISLKSFSLFLRVLYNATYLSNDYSEKALELIDKAVVSISFGNDLPRSILVADRTGGRKITDNNKEYTEVYDCGIVYYPSHPYVLCILARSQNLDTLKKFFEGVGLKVYADVAYQYR